MSVGDLAKPGWGTDIGIIVATEASDGEQHAALLWSCGKVQWFDYELLEVISESR